MRVTHLCLGCFYPDGFSYQENMLPKFHKQLGYEVSVIASLQTYDTDGKTKYLSGASSYINEYGIPVERIEYKAPAKLFRKLKSFRGTYKALEKAAPDILFIHGCQFLDMSVVVKYLKKHRNVKVFVDNHADFNNSAMGFFSKNVIHKILWKRAARSVDPFVTKWYGVLPARVDFLRDVYKLPENKTELLVMGADDDTVGEATAPGKREEIRKKHGIEEDDFLVVTGGKITVGKKRIIDLMAAVNKIDEPKLKLIVFGSVAPELTEQINSNCSDRVKYIGWVTSEVAYHYFAAAELAVFPGKHSVFWEQVAGLGIPMLCTRFDGFEHVDVGGNVVFLEHKNETEMQDIIEELISDKEKYREMKKAAVDGMDVFSYRSIAQRSIRG